MAKDIANHDYVHEASINPQEGSVSVPLFFFLESFRAWEPGFLGPLCQAPGSMRAEALGTHDPGQFAEESFKMLVGSQ